MTLLDALPIALGVLLVALSTLFALQPLFRRDRVASVPAVDDLDLGAERRGLYRQVLDLEFDRETGKLSPEDYALLSDGLLARAAASLRAERAGGDAIPASNDDPALEDEVEREISAARRALAAARPARAPRPSAVRQEAAP